MKIRIEVGRISELGKVRVDPFHPQVQSIQSWDSWNIDPRIHRIAGHELPFHRVVPGHVLGIKNNAPSESGGMIREVELGDSLAGVYRLAVSSD